MLADNTTRSSVLSLQVAAAVDHATPVTLPASVVVEASLLVEPVRHGEPTCAHIKIERSARKTLLIAIGQRLDEQDPSATPGSCSAGLSLVLRYPGSLRQILHIFAIACTQDKWHTR